MGLHKSGWSFSFNNRKRHLGLCRFREKEIQLSCICTEHEDEERILNTIRHEIAHAIAGYEANHGPIWKAVAIRIGASPRANGNVNTETREVLNTKIKYVMVCPKGLVHNTYYRKPNRKTFMSLHLYFVKGDRAGTKGKLTIEAYNPNKHLIRG